MKLCMSFGIKQGPIDKGITQILDLSVLLAMHVKTRLLT